MTAARRSIFTRLYHGETNVDFVGRKRLWFALSSAIILVGLVSLFTRGLNFGIDFEGGAAWEVEAPTVSVDEARDALRPLGLGDAKIQTLGEDRLRVQAEPGDEARREAVRAELGRLAGVDPATVSVNEVGPSWGGEITRKAQRALAVFLVVITLYITLRFEWKAALATLAALFHDILVTVGVYSLTGFEVTPATVIALLTILGYSIYDGIVVFDKVEENTKGLASSGRSTYSDSVNQSLNQVLMRSLNTSITALLPILSLLVIGSFVLGATTLQEFALALLIGLGASAYSSIFIASPLLALLKEREPRYASLRERASRPGGAVPRVLTPAAAGASRVGARSLGGGGVSGARGGGSGGAAVAAAAKGARKPAGAPGRPAGASRVGSRSLAATRADGGDGGAVDRFVQDDSGLGDTGSGPDGRGLEGLDDREPGDREPGDREPGATAAARAAPEPQRPKPSRGRIGARSMGSVSEAELRAPAPSPNRPPPRPRKKGKKR